MYLQSTPEECLKRIHKRGRIEEKNIDIKYLQQLHTLHEEWLTNEKNVLSINLGQNVDCIVEKIKKKIFSL